MKSIYELSNKEGKEVDLKLKQSSYFRQFSFAYIFSILISVFGIIGFEIGVSLGETRKITTETSYIVWAIFLGFCSINTLLFLFKRFDLIKNYYEQNK